MAAQLGVGVVGLGFVGAGAHLHSFRKLKQANLAAVCDLNEKTLAKKAKRHDVSATYTDYRKMLEDPNVDAVVVSVPTDHHARIAIDALQAGKHVICEMPFAPNLEDVDKMLAAAKESGKILMPSLNFRFTPNYVKAKQLIDAGELGMPIRPSCIASGFPRPTWPCSGLRDPGYGTWRRREGLCSRWRSGRSTSCGG